MLVLINFLIILISELKFETLKVWISLFKIIAVHAKEALMIATTMKILSYLFMGDAIVHMTKCGPMKMKNALKSQPIVLNLVVAFVAAV